MGVIGAGGGLSAAAIAGITVASVVVVGGIAFAATSGFGLLADGDQETPAATSATVDGANGIVPGERKEDGNIEDTLMERAFAAGKSVECNYTVEGYETTTTMKSNTVFRIDQQAQGGLVHVVRGEDTTLVWVDGMSAAEEFDTARYEADAPVQYPSFNPAEFDEATTLDPTVCVEIPAADDGLFTLPAGMSSAPGTL